ncbi:non-ribosomal peptide synthetase [Rubrivivax gelatinosus]|uniref:non-ribosomal peptide synthetase n=1 Tax=Rubrivivax gelatinosus TaxID=28068 RepID=UPI00030887E5|nr:non-ribosomal peptide synthetase [Rubrivivax gelatinosus]MBG6082449.1 amino acid adenylation domain-containing protein [Rubrivivax gelatinosus]
MSTISPTIATTTPLAYWQAFYGREVPVAFIPAERVRSKVYSAKRETLGFVLPDPVSERLGALTKGNDALLLIAMLSAFAAVMSRYSGLPTMRLGMPGRADATGITTAAALGLDIEVGAQATFRQLLLSVRDGLATAHEYERLSHQDLLAALGREHVKDRCPLFDVVVRLEGFHGPLPEELRNDVTLTVRCEAGRVHVDVDFSVRLIDRAAIQRFNGHVATLLAQCLHSMEEPVQRLRLTTDAEAAWLREVATGAAQPGAFDLFARFDDMLRQKPGAIAAVFAGEATPYARLGVLVDELASELLARGAAPGRPIGVLLTRGVHGVAALMAVLRIGAVYVPLDPQSPRERLTMILEDCAPAVVVSSSAVEPDVRAMVPCQVVLADLLRGAAPTSVPAPAMSATDDAYIIYTSGTTGRPKGVRVGWRVLRNLLHWQVARFEPGGARRVLQFTSVTFDVSLQEVLSTLALGGTLVIATEDERRDILQLERLLRNERVQRAFLPRTVLEHLAEIHSPSDGELKDLSEIITAGEQLRITPSIARLMRSLRDALLENQYGPSETHVITSHTLSGAPSAWALLPPIGRPIWNTRVLVLDDNLQQVPVGVVGEVYAGGAGVGNGYLNAPELTAARFVPDRYCHEPGALMYRTGDRARLLANGDIQFIGRVDNQVKVRGFRVELEEVEASLRRLLEVPEAAVLFDADEGRMTAFVAARAGLGEVTTLRERLTGYLPDPMIPSLFVVLPDLPRNSHGKIDKTALKDMGRGSSATLTPATDTPRTALETELVSLWCELLSRPAVGIHDNFFQLGGHSLVAAQMIARIRNKHGVDIPLRRLFETPTVAGLAVAVERVSQARPESQVAAAPGNEQADGSFPLTELQQAYWLGRSAGFGSGGVGAHGYSEIDCTDLSVDRLEAALNMVIERHDMLRAVITPEGRQRVLADLPTYRILRHDWSGLDGEVAEQQVLARREALSHEMFDPQQWPTFRVESARLPSGRVRLFVSSDSVFLDAQSWQVVLRDLGRFYLEPSAVLPALSFRFRDYVLQREREKQSEAYRRAQAYWDGRISSMPLAPQLPLAKDPAALGVPEFVRRSFTLGPSHWAAFKTHAAAVELTPSVAVLAAFAEIVRRWSSAPDFLLNVTLFDRPTGLDAQVQEVVGDFTSTVLLQVPRSGAADDFATRAARTQTQLWTDLDHRQWNGISVLRTLGRSHSLGARPVAPYVFTSTIGQNSHGGASSLMLEHVGGREVHSITQTPQVWLDHQASETDGMLVLNWDSLHGLFPPGLLDAAFAGYRSLLERLAVDAEAWREPVWHAAADFPLEPASPWKPPRRPLHDGIADFADHAPDAAALISPNEVVSRAGLEAWANDLAHRLHAHGLQAQETVAIIMGKGPRQAVAALGILRAGGAYVPLARELPELRLREILQACGARAVLVDDESVLAGALPEGVMRIVVPLLRGEAPPARPAPAVEIGADALAYVIYTSGSTGAPKGVMIEHAAARNTVEDLNELLGLGAGDRILGVSAQGFDLSVYDTFGALAAGAAEVFPRSDAVDPEHWARLVREHGVTVWNSVPALMDVLVEFVRDKPDLWPESLRVVLLSGDWIPVGLPGRIRAIAPNARILSLGGATEASIWSVIYPVGEVDPAWKSIPYGRAMRGQSMHVLDADMRPCPVWVPGSLYIGGVGVARGYRGDAERTAASFVCCPATGERLYRTGDVARWLPDGNLELLGREDFQIKLRGFRIEAGEIEAQLRRCEDVAEAVVVPVGSPVRALVAAVVPAHAQAASHPAAAFAGGWQLRARLQGDAIAALSADGVMALLSGDTSAHARRRSHRRFEDGALSVEQLGRLLTVLRAVRSPMGLAKYRYPSASSLYPVRTLLWAPEGGVEGLVAGAYRYDPEAHALARLPRGEDATRSIESALRGSPLAERAAFMMLLVIDRSAYEATYGARGDRYALIEAGHMAQALMEEAPALKIGLCELGEPGDELVQHIASPGPHEFFATAIVGGRITALQVGFQAFDDELLAMAPRPSDPRTSWREHLQAVLPRYMVPAEFLVLDRLPLTPNGKIDRALLSRRAEEALRGADHVNTAQTDLERAVAAVWGEVLGLQSVDVETNFFELGGTSIGIVQAHRLLVERLDRPLAITALFQHPTVRAFASALETAAVADSGSQASAQRANHRQAALRQRRAAVVPD